MTEAIFAALAFLTLGAGGAAVLGRPGQGLAGLALLAVAAAATVLFFAASGVALVLLAAVGAAALVLRVAWAEAPGAAEEPAPSRRRIAAVVAALAGFAWVLVGTWARQFVWTGRPPAPGSGFGGLPAVAEALAGSPGLVAVGLVAVAVVAGCALPPRPGI